MSAGPLLRLKRRRDQRACEGLETVLGVVFTNETRRRRQVDLRRARASTTTAVLILDDDMRDVDHHQVVGGRQVGDLRADVSLSLSPQDGSSKR